MRQRIQGFTLVEMVTTIILISILAAVAAPRLAVQDYDNAFFRDGFIGAMRHAKKIAVATQIDVAVVPDPATRKIHFLFRSQSGAFDYPVPSPYALNASTAFVLDIPRDTEFVPPPQSIYFDPRGRAHNAVTNQVPVGEFTYMVNGRRVQVVGETGFAYEDQT